MQLTLPMYRALRIAQRSSVVLIAFFLVACGGSSEPEASNPTAPSNNPVQSTPAATPAPVAVADGNGKLKIFILAGQSNMVGFGKVELGADMKSATRTPHILGGAGSLRGMVNSSPAAFRFLVDPVKTVTYTVKGVTQTYTDWASRDDVWVSSWDSGAIGKTTELRNGALNVG